MTPGIVAESDLTGNLQSEYVFFGGERVARKDFPAGTVSYYFSDHLKTASVITNSSGAITEDEDYYPWGGELQFVNNDSNHYKFTGKERDAETGLDYFGARYYSSALSRFTSADPIQLKKNRFLDPQRLNLYVYARSNALAYTDPDGKDAIALAYQDSHYAGPGAVVGNSMWSLGHAGIITVDSKGHATYYDKNGTGVHKEPLGTFKVDKNGKLSNRDTAEVVQKMSKEHGESGKVKYAYFKADDDKVNKMNQEGDKRAASDPPEKYGPVGANCAEFVGDLLKDAGLANTDAVRPNGMFDDIKGKADYTATLNDATDKSKENLVRKLDGTDQTHPGP